MELDEGAAVATINYEPFLLIQKHCRPAELTCSQSDFMKAALRLSTSSLKCCMTRDTAERYIRVLDKCSGGADLNAAIEEALDGADNSMPASLRKFITRDTYEKCEGARSKLRKKDTQKEVLLLEDYLLEAYKAAQQLMDVRQNSKVFLQSLMKQFRSNTEDKERNAELLRLLLPSNWHENAGAATTTAMVPMIPSIPAGTDAMTTTQQDRSNEPLMALVAALASNGGGGGLNLSINTGTNNNEHNVDNSVQNVDNSVQNVHHNHYHAPPQQQAAITKSEMEEMLEPLAQNTAQMQQNTAQTQQMVQSLSVRKPHRSSSFNDSMAPLNWEDQFTNEVESPGREQCLSRKVGPKFIEERYQSLQGDAERLCNIGIKNPMRCRDEIGQDFPFPCAHLSLPEHSEEHFGKLLLDHLLQGHDAKCQIGCSVLTTDRCLAAIMIEYDERDDNWDYDQADSNANPLMPALCLTKQYITTITFEDEDGNKENVLIVVYFREGAAANMMAAAIRAVTGVPNARTVKIEGEDTEFAHCLSCNRIAWSESLQAYPPDTLTTLQFKLIDFPEEQSTPLVLSCARLMFENCSFKNSGTDFPQADVLYRYNHQGHEKKVKIRVCFAKAINFKGKTEEMLNNLGQAIQCGTMSFLCFIDIRLSREELTALRNVCQTALANGWNVIVDETDVEVDLDQDKHIVLRELSTENKKKHTCDVYQYCTKAEDEELPPLISESTKTDKTEQVGPASNATTKEEEGKLLPTLNNLSNNGGDGHVNHGDSTKEGNPAPKASSGGNENAEKQSDAIGKEVARRGPKDNKPQLRRSRRIATRVDKTAS